MLFAFSNTWLWFCRADPLVHLNLVSIGGLVSDGASLGFILVRKSWTQHEVPCLDGFNHVLQTGKPASAWKYWISDYTLGR